MPDRPGVANVADALGVRRQARRGFALGALFAVSLYVFFVVLPGTARPSALYVMLGFVAAVSSGLLFTIVLVAVAAYRLAQRLD